MRVVQSVFGVFHHFELAHQLHQRNYLTQIFSTWPWLRLKREGIPHSLVSTFPLLHTADYMLARSRYYPESASAVINRMNTLLFDEWTARKIPMCDAYIAISGSGLKTGKLVQQRGGKFICDRGSVHQRLQEDILRKEYQRWKLTPPPENLHLRTREEEIYRVADAITVPSSVAKRSFVDLGIDASKVHVIPYGVRLDRFAHDAAQSSTVFDVLFVGQVGLRKGIPYLLEAFARLNHPNKHLTVIGAIQNHIRLLLEVLPTSNVTFLGSVPQHEVIRHMNRAQVLVLPSIEEGLALVQAQAMACGCPVIATVATGCEDLFQDRVEGFIVLDRDVDALTDRLQSVADDPELRERLSENAIKRVQSIGGWDEYGKKWETLLLALGETNPAH